MGSSSIASPIEFRWSSASKFHLTTLTVLSSETIELVQAVSLENGDALTQGPNDQVWSSNSTEYRRSQGGMGGRPLDYSTGKILRGLSSFFRVSSP